MKIISLLLLVIACSHNPYEKATPEAIASFKTVRLPFQKGTELFVATTPYTDENKIYAWNFNVPFGTSVVSMDDGKVIQLWEPEGGGGCDKKFSSQGHNIKVQHLDGTVAQYLHIKARVKKNAIVKKGQIIAETANNGYLCSPQLHVSVWESANGAGIVGQGKSIPVKFEGAPEVIKQKEKLVVP